MGASVVAVVAWRGRSERASRAVEGVRRSVFCCLLWPWILWPLRVQRTVYTPVYCTFIYNPITFTPHSCLTVRIPSARSALPCVSFTLSCVSVCFRNIHVTRPCDLRRHAYCTEWSPVNHWPAPATRRRRRGSNCIFISPTGPSL